MPHPSTSSAYGIWSLNEVRDAERGDNWPSVPITFTYTAANLDSGTADNAFDGSLSTSANVRNAGSYVEVTFNKSLSGTLEVNVTNGNDSSDDNLVVTVDSVQTETFDVSSQVYYTLNTGSSFTTVRVAQSGSTTGSIFAFRLDGTVLTGSSGSGSV